MSAPAIPPGAPGARLVRSSTGDIIGIGGGATPIPLGNHDRFPMRKLQASRGKMRAGQRNSRELYLGDSTLVGSGSTGSAGYLANGRFKNMTTHLSAEMNKSFWPTNCHALWGDGNLAVNATLTTFDPRIVLESGWTLAASAENSIGVRAYRNTNTGSAMHFTPNVAGNSSANVDTFIIWYIQKSDAGVFTLALDGGVALQTVVATNATSTLKSVTLTTTLGAHTLDVAWVSGNVWVQGIQAFDSSVKQIEIWNAGYSAGKVSDFLVNATAWSMLNAIPLIAPDLTVIQLEINQVINNVDRATTVAGLQTLITACQATGDVVLRTSYPSDITYNAYTPLANQRLYRDDILNLGAKNGILVDNLFDRCGSYELIQAVPGGGMMSDQLHPSEPLYSESARSLFNILNGY